MATGKQEAFIRKLMRERRLIDGAGHITGSLRNIPGVKVPQPDEGNISTWVGRMSTKEASAVIDGLLKTPGVRQSPSMKSPPRTGSRLPKQLKYARGVRVEGKAQADAIAARVQKAGYDIERVYVSRDSDEADYTTPGYYVYMPDEAVDRWDTGLAHVKTLGNISEERKSDIRDYILRTGSAKGYQPSRSVLDSEQSAEQKLQDADTLREAVTALIGGRKWTRYGPIVRTGGMIPVLRYEGKNQDDYLPLPEQRIGVQKVFELDDGDLYIVDRERSYRFSTPERLRQYRLESKAAEGMTLEEARRGVNSPNIGPDQRALYQAVIDANSEGNNPTLDSPAPPLSAPSSSAERALRTRFAAHAIEHSIDTRRRAKTVAPAKPANDKERSQHLRWKADPSQLDIEGIDTPGSVVVKDAMAIKAEEVRRYQESKPKPSRLTGRRKKL